jgi:hypothetical protein
VAAPTNPVNTDSPVSMQICTLNDASQPLRRHPEWRSTPAGLAQRGPVTAGTSKRRPLSAGPSAPPIAGVRVGTRSALPDLHLSTEGFPTQQGLFDLGWSWFHPAFVDRPHVCPPIDRPRAHRAYGLAGRRSRAVLDGTVDGDPLIRDSKEHRHVTHEQPGGREPAHDRRRGSRDPGSVQGVRGIAVRAIGR